jgi:hypothetical protein
MKQIVIITLAFVLLFLPSSAFATGNIHVDSYCEDGIFHLVLNDPEDNPIENAKVFTMKGRSNVEEKFFSNENGIVEIKNEQNTGLVKILKTKFYDQTYPTKPCEMITPEIPSWVKNNGKWWSENQIDDESFISGIQFLIENNILKIPQVRIEKQTDANSNTSLPSWVKTNVGWWADGKVTQSEFISSMQFLVKSDIIKIPERKVIMEVEQSASSSKLSVSGGNVVFHPEALEIFLIYTTHNLSCTTSEIKMMEKYQKITEEYLKEQNLGRKLIVNQACLQMNEINANMYPVLLAQLNVMRPDLMIFVGDLTSNLELYYQEDAYGVWGCMSITSSMQCLTSTIIVCECAPMYREDNTNGGMWVLSHELAHFLFNYKNFGANVYGDAVHVVEYNYRECLENGFTESCEQYYIQKEVDGVTYDLMNLDLIKNQYRTLLAEIPTIEKEFELLNLKEMDVTITGKDILAPLEQQNIKLILKDYKKPISNVQVSANVIDSLGNVVKDMNAISKSDGMYLFSWNLGSETKSGSYQVIIEIHHEEFISKRQIFSYTVE